MVSDLREINANNELKVSSLVRQCSISNFRTPVFSNNYLYFVCVCKYKQIKDKEVLFATVMAESRAEEQKILFETDAYLKTKKAEVSLYKHRHLALKTVQPGLTKSPSYPFVLFRLV